MPQTRRVKLYGLPSEEVRVALNETRLAMLGISIDEVAAALSRADARTPAGQLTGAGAALTVELTGEFTDLESVRGSSLGPARRPRHPHCRPRRSDQNRVTPFDSVSLSNGHRSVLIAAEMQPGYQVDRYGARFDEFLSHIALMRQRASVSRRPLIRRVTPRIVFRASLKTCSWASRWCYWCCS